jgi:hypothetical protein
VLDLRSDGVVRVSPISAFVEEVERRIDFLELALNLLGHRPFFVGGKLNRTVFKSITLTEEPRRTASVMIPVVDQAPAPTMKPEKRRDTKPVRTFRDAFTEALDDF